MKLSFNEPILKDFARELRTWARLDHPNILPLLGFYLGEQQMEPWMISKWHNKGDVYKYLQALEKVNNPPSVEVRLELVMTPYGSMTRCPYIQSFFRSMIQSPGSYTSIHTTSSMEISSRFVIDKAGRPTLIVTRQNNVIINEEGRAMLCDFGLARLEEDEPSGLTTSLGLRDGDARYMSPDLLFVGDMERLDDDAISVLSDHLPNGSFRTTASDIWAFGCTALLVWLPGPLRQT